MKKFILALGFVALAFLASPALCVDDWQILPETLIRGVSVSAAFKGLDGKLQPAGNYDLKLHKGKQGILIGLLRNGKTVAEFPGKFVPGASEPPNSDRKGGMRPRVLNFDDSSKVSTGGGGGAGKILVSSTLHPGGANLGWIEFQLPQGQASGK